MCGLISFPSWNFTLKLAEANFYELFNVNWLLGVSSEHLLHAELSSRFPVPVIGSYEKFIENYNFKRAASFLEKSTWLPVKIRTFRYAVFVINNLIAIRYNFTEVNYTRYNIPITVYENRKNILFLVSKIELLRGFSKRRVLVAILNRAMLGNELNKISEKRRKEEKEKKREKKRVEYVRPDFPSSYFNIAALANRSPWGTGRGPRFLFSKHSRGEDTIDTVDAEEEYNELSTNEIQARRVEIIFHSTTLRLKSVRNKQTSISASFCGVRPR